MAIKIISRDTASLPGDMLERAKGRLRLNDQNDDDLDVQDMIAAAIEQFEQFAGITIYKTVYEWTPDASDFGCSGALASVPITPVGTWTAAADPAAANVTANYTMTTRGIFGVQQYYLGGAYASGLAVTIASGYDASTIPAGIRRAMFQAVSTLYEYREILVPSNLQQMPGWLTSMLAGYWQPRV